MVKSVNPARRRKIPSAMPPGPAPMMPTERFLAIFAPALSDRQALAAVDDEFRAGDERGLFGDEEGDRVGDLGGPAQPAGGHGGRQPPLGGVVEHRGGHRSRQYG